MEKRNQKRLRVFLIILVSAFVVAQVLPTLAENFSGSSSSSDTSTVTTLGQEPVVPSPSESPGLGEEEVSEGAENSLPTDQNPEPMVSASSPPPPPPPFATSTQDLLINLPTSLRVDPRATSVFLPRSIFSSSNTLLLCLYGSVLEFDLGQPGIIDDTDSELIKIKGDRSNTVMISGYSTFVNSFINSELGMRIYREGGVVGGQLALFKFVDISEPSLDEKLCLDGSSQNNRYLEVRSLGLTLNISKAKVELDKRARKGGK